MPLRVRVCRVDEVPAGELRGFPVPGVDVPVMVANVDGQLWAATSRCPHEDVSLLGGRREGTVVTCPGHGYELDLATGRCRHDPSLVLARYPVTVIGGDVYVDLIPG